MNRFSEAVAQGVRGNETLVAFIECEISYSGRAETHLRRGDRLLIIKSDQSVLVHQPSGSTPVNYMKPGSIISIEGSERRLVMHVMNEKERAWLDVEIFQVYDIQKRKLADGQKLDLSGNERDMSDWIRDNPQSISKKFRAVSREEQTDVGFIDVLGHDAGRLVVVECKRVTASLSAVDQLRRYVERVKQIKGQQDVHGVLAAPGITPNAKEMLQSWGFEFRQVEPPKRLERWQKDQKQLGEY